MAPAMRCLRAQPRGARASTGGGGAPAAAPLARRGGGGTWGEEEGWGRVGLPAIEIEPSFEEAAVAAALQALTAGAYAWAVFTSANAVELWFDLMRKQALDARALGGVRVAAIGPATAEALAERGIAADAVPEEYVAEA